MTESEQLFSGVGLKRETSLRTRHIDLRHMIFKDMLAPIYNHTITSVFMILWFNREKNL